MQSGADAGFLRGVAQLKIVLDFEYTCRESACREQRIVARGVWGHTNFSKIVQFRAF